MLSASIMLLLGANSVTQTQKIERPAEIWVFRSVLDRHARMVTIGLNKDLWVAYDATNCGLYKAWTGGVKFDGAVYTSVHGPQPTSIGTPYYLTSPGLNAWQWKHNGTISRTNPTFRGYRMVRGQVVLNYEIPIENGKPIRIHETPEYAGSPGNNVVFTRSIKVEGLPQGDELGVFVQEMGASTKTETSGKYQSDSARKGGVVWLKPGTTEIKFTSPKSGIPGGIHNDSNQEAPAPKPTQQESAEREPGFSVRIYDLGKTVSQLPRLVRAQSPNISFVGQVVDFKTAADFKGIEDNFLVHITGYINPKIAGTYKFRLTSDDGSKFHIRDTVIVNNDGLHGATPQEGEFDLNPGEHPFLIEYFEGTSDNVLKLEWMVPGTTEYVVVPAWAFTTPKGEVRVTAPGTKLIMEGNGGRPGDRQPLDGVHPSYDLQTIRPKDFKPRVGGIDFLPDGRMVICNWEPDGGVYVLEGVLGDTIASQIKVTRIAAGLAEPLGIKVVNGEIYVLQKQELTKLIDHNRDGIIDEYYAVANGWGVTSNFHEFAFGLVYDKGYFYAALATAIDPGGASTKPQNPDRGKVVKISRDGKFELIASGLRTPNGIGLGYKNRIYIADNQGDWLPSSKIVEVIPGAFYGSHSVDPIGSKSLKETLPVVWLPQGEIGNSPSQPGQINDGPYKGQMIHGDVTHGGVKRVFVEEVNGQLQGVVFRFTQGLEGGINRLAWGPDGALYVGGIGSTGNWGQEGKERFGLQKIKYNGKSTFEILAVRAKTNGVELELTEPLGEGQGQSPAFYTLMRWKYVPTEQYGGPKINERNIGVKSVTVSRDRKRVFLETDGLLENHMIYVRCHPSISSKDGKIMWSTEAWYTMNQIPKNLVVKPNPATATSPSGPSNEELRNNFVAIFDGKNLNNFKGWKQDAVSPGWKVSEDGSLAFEPTSGARDIATKKDYSNFELRFSWKVSKGANSGVFYLADESKPLSWSTGPEYQILDNEEHADGASPLTSAASNYALIAPAYDVTRPVGEWNDARIVVRGMDVEHWLNGVLVVKYTFNSPSWKRLVADSKFKDLATYGQARSGKIIFQNHGDPVWFRNIRIKELK